MIKIGKAATKFNISNRTLRYWEEKGILKSVRAENDYRFYDETNIQRIKQIVLLRKLKMPISEIEKIFISNRIEDAITALTRHFENLKDETIMFYSLSQLTEKLIVHMQDQKSLNQIFDYLELTMNDLSNEHTSTHQIILSERMTVMSTHQMENVRIVKLPSMTVASYRAIGTSPESECAKVFNRFVLENRLHKRDGFRYFGFNNPNPSEDSPEYGYEMWVTIPDEFNVPAPLERKLFEGGLYASISTHMNEIGERWYLLFNWGNENDKYMMDMSVQWLEECTMDFESFNSNETLDSEKQLDLLAPIKLKKIKLCDSHKLF